MTSPDIRIGTLINGNDATGSYLRQILPHGFESFELCFGWGTDCRNWDLDRLAADIAAALDGHDAVISTVGFYGNPLLDDTDGEVARTSIATLIDRAADFGATCLCGFTGALSDRSLPDNRERFIEVWRPLAERAGERGISIGFENCSMGGSWKTPRYNLAICPRAWEILFEAIPLSNLGLEWEPCHQMVQLADPMPQLREWVSRIVHVHGKDASVHWDVVTRHGIHSGLPYAYHRSPGFGDSNWTDIISTLRSGGFKGSIDIEGWHDPVYRGELEMTGQVHGLRYLHGCRGAYVANPVEE